MPTKPEPPPHGSGSGFVSGFAAPTDAPAKSTATAIMSAKQRKSTIAASPEVSSALAIFYIFDPIKFNHGKKMAA